MKVFLYKLSIVLILVFIQMQFSFAQRKQILIDKSISKDTYEARVKYKKYFDKANFYLNNRELDSAILNFTFALDQYKHADAYYNRGVTNLRNGRRVDFCKDMREARMLGDFDADSLYCLKCMKRDSIYYDSLGKVSTSENSFKFESREKALFDTSIVSDTFIRGNDGLYTLSLYRTFSVKCKNPITKLPSFSGGLSGIQKTDLLKMAPPGIMGDYDEIVTNCSFRISPEGEVINVKYLKGNSKYNNITKNRLLRMGKWEPATLNGEYVDVELILERVSTTKLIYISPN